MKVLGKTPDSDIEVSAQEDIGLENAKRGTPIS